MELEGGEGNPPTHTHKRGYLDFVHMQIPHEECDHYVLQTCTDKKKIKQQT